MLSLNSKAPNFTAPDQNEKEHSLSEYTGKWVVLYFYPKDDTPGCTKEACNFRDTYHQLQSMCVVVIGISKDSVASHKRFAQKYNLNFPILADPQKKIIESYGAWGTKKFMGREFIGIKRITYLINPKGQIAKIYIKVNPLTHSTEMIDDLNQLSHKQ